MLYSSQLGIELLS